VQTDVATMAQLIAEAYRLSLLGRLEAELRLAGYPRLAGVDEVGRGCLAGPVVAAAVVFGSDGLIPGVDDSKRLGAGERERLAALIRERAEAVAIGVVAADVIDRINILQATRRAMLECLWSLAPPPDLTLIDAVALDGAPCHCLPLVRGDTLSYAIACASIVAKVERDRLMTELDTRYPQYGFSQHKGYAAPSHLEALATYGPTPVHRLTFHSVVPRRGMTA
jgi:ribonuclease HII